MFNKKIVLYIFILLASINLSANISLKEQRIKIYDVKNSSAKISKGNLKIGQSGIIQHFYKNNNSIILKNAFISKSFEKYSIIKFSDFTELKQKAIPNIDRKVQNDDIFILNFLYSSSLLITPNQNAFIKTRKMFPAHNFVHSDIFATFLKLQNQPYPSKTLLKKYAIKENIGTIFYVIENKVYIYDTKTFKNIDSYEIQYNMKKVQLPFYTRIEKIKKGNFDFSDTKFINSDLNTNNKYIKYYKNFLGIKND